MIIWLTGLPCSGKTTIATSVVELIKSAGHKVELLDGDVIRRELWAELTFSKSDREENVRRLGIIAGFLSAHGVIAVVSAVSPYRESRALVRRASRKFVEVYVNAPVEVCEKRDVKGMYRRANSGEIPRFTGVSDPYEPPLNPDVECRTDMESIDESVSKIMQVLSTVGAYFTGNGDGV